MINWLRKKTAFPQVYWKPRNKGLHLAAVGEGMLAPFHIAPFSTLKGSLWEGFSRQTSFSFQSVQSGIAENCPKLRVPCVKKVSFLPNFTEWKRLVAKAKGEILKGSFTSIVLARKLHIELSYEIDPLHLFHTLLSFQNLYGFYFSPKKGRAFFGASPERFLRIQGSTLETEALAATKKEGKEQELLEERKELIEFYYVEKGIQEALWPHLQNIEMSKTKVQRSQNVFHLQRTLRGKLLEKQSVDDLIKKLHPNAAILGENNEKTWQFLRENEPFERGLYAGVFGRKEAGDLDCCIPIRSCLVKGRSVYLFSGVHISLASEAEREWQELDDKLEPYMKRLSLRL